MTNSRPERSIPVLRDHSIHERAISGLKTLKSTLKQSQASQVPFHARQGPLLSLKGNLITDLRCPNQDLMSYSMFDDPSRLEKHLSHPGWPASGLQRATPRLWAEGPSVNGDPLPYKSSECAPARQHITKSLESPDTGRSRVTGLYLPIR